MKDFDKKGNALQRQGCSNDTLLPLVSKQGGTGQGKAFVTLITGMNCKFFHTVKIFCKKTHFFTGFHRNFENIPKLSHFIPKLSHHSKKITIFLWPELKELRNNNNCNLSTLLNTFTFLKTIFRQSHPFCSVFIFVFGAMATTDHIYMNTVDNTNFAFNQPGDRQITTQVDDTSKKFFILNTINT